MFLCCLLYSLVVISNSNSERTEVLCVSENVIHSLSKFVSKSKTLSSCGDSGAPSLIIEVKEYHELITGLKNRGAKIRYITDITKDNVAYCKEMMNLDMEIRHLEGIKANFSVSESEYMAASTLSHENEKGVQIPKSIQQVIYSNVEDIVEQQKYVFESFWNRAVLGEDRIMEIEEGVTTGSTEVIRLPIKTKELYIDLVKKSGEEILLLIPSINAFLRQEKLGIMEFLKEAALERGVNVKVLTPTNDMVNEKTQNLIKNIDNFVIQPFEFASGETNANTVTIIVVDRKESLVIERKDDSKKDFVDAIGLSTHSTSNPTVISYTSIFERLASQVKLYDQSQTHGKMQEEFINIASHELRTPTQAILTYSDLLQHHPEKRDEMIQAIQRNATRLQKLTEDILDVTKIESKTLNLHKEKLNLRDLLSTAIDDYRSDDNVEGKIKLIYDNANEELFLVEADCERVSQVLHNLLDNAIKFTEEEEEEGDVFVVMEKETKDNSQEVIVRIKDKGRGIDNEIMPRLFTKFATKSTKGTGLGLFICKGIIEAHGWKIWAENNKHGKGATFSFSLPVND